VRNFAQQIAKFHEIKPLRCNFSPLNVIFSERLYVHWTHTNMPRRPLVAEKPICHSVQMGSPHRIKRWLVTIMGTK
tara:strand:- start:5798 stop:6025 length:228 start_codon:yes stop_codon:yes gene_type:complete